MKKITKDQVIQKLEELGIRYESVGNKNYYIELIHFLTNLTSWLELQSWSVKEGYVELTCENKIYLFSLDLTSRIEPSSINNYEVCKFPELKKIERIFSHYSGHDFSCEKDFEENVIESDKGDVLIISESLGAFVSQVSGFEMGCASYTHIDKFANLDFVKCKVADPYIISLKPTNKIHVKNDGFYFGFETISGLKFFARIYEDGEIEVSF